MPTGQQQRDNRLCLLHQLHAGLLSVRQVRPSGLSRACCPDSAIGHSCRQANAPRPSLHSSSRSRYSPWRVLTNYNTTYNHCLSARPANRTRFGTSTVLASAALTSAVCAPARPSQPATPHSTVPVSMPAAPEEAAVMLYLAANAGAVSCDCRGYGGEQAILSQGPFPAPLHLPPTLLLIAPP